jgi:hypothetical protein
MKLPLGSTGVGGALSTTHLAGRGKGRRKQGREVLSAARNHGEARPVEAGRLVAASALVSGQGPQPRWSAAREKVGVQQPKFGGDALPLLRLLPRAIEKTSRILSSRRYDGQGSTC